MIANPEASYEFIKSEPHNYQNEDKHSDSKEDGSLEAKWETLNLEQWIFSMEAYVYQDIVILAVFTFFYSTVTGAIERTWISDPITMTVVCTIILSIIARGVSANPFHRPDGSRTGLCGAGKYRRIGDSCLRQPSDRLCLNRSYPSLTTKISESLKDYCYANTKSKRNRSLQGAFRREVLEKSWKWAMTQGEKGR